MLEPLYRKDLSLVVKRAPSHGRDCHFADALSPSLLIHLPKGEVHQNDSLVNGYGRPVR